jgi:hypothetical protein
MSELLPSEQVIVAAPMSLAGSAERWWKLARYPHGDGWMTALRALVIIGVLLAITVSWAVVLCWYLLWGIWLIPYRIIRRGQRRRRQAQLRHGEMMEALGYTAQKH